MCRIVPVPLYEADLRNGENYKPQALSIKLFFELSVIFSRNFFSTLMYISGFLGVWIEQMRASILPYMLLSSISVSTITLSFSRLFPTLHFQAPMLQEFFVDITRGLWITILVEGTLLDSFHAFPTTVDKLFQISALNV